MKCRQKDSFMTKFLAVILALGGGLLLAYVFVPILAYEFAAPTRFDNFLSPIPNQTQVAFSDSTKASNWFVGGAPKEDFALESGVKFYTLSVPVLGIEDATVAIGGEDLAESLIQYPGTALPGKRGNTVIFGHSILPQFYNPKSYLSIFSKLPTLKKGDEITVSYDGVTYKYIVEDLFEVYPTDIQVLEQDQSDSFLTLVTCVPPGHPLKPKRLIVRARVVQL